MSKSTRGYEAILRFERCEALQLCFVRSRKLDRFLLRPAGCGDEDSGRSAAPSLRANGSARSAAQ